MSDYFEKEKREKAKEIHPVWRGIGLIMIFLIPILSFALSDVLLQSARSNGIVIPLELQSGMTELPVYGPVLDLKAVLIFGFAIMLVLFGLFTIINAAVYRGSKDSTYQIFQAAPKQYKRKRKLKKPTYEK
jgi:hypothetical protein